MTCFAEGELGTKPEPTGSESKIGPYWVHTENHKGFQLLMSFWSPPELNKMCKFFKRESKEKIGLFTLSRSERKTNEEWEWKKWKRILEFDINVDWCHLK